MWDLAGEVLAQGSHPPAPGRWWLNDLPRSLATRRVFDLSAQVCSGQHPNCLGQQACLRLWPPPLLRPPPPDCGPVPTPNPGLWRHRKSDRLPPTDLQQINFRTALVQGLQQVSVETGFSLRFTRMGWTRASQGQAVL